MLCEQFGALGFSEGRKEVKRSLWGTAAVAVVMVAATGLTTGAADPDQEPPGQVVRTLHGQGYGPGGRHDVTVREIINPDGSGSAEVIDGGVSSVDPVTHQTPGKPEITASDLEAWVNDTSTTDDGPQPDSDGVITYVDGPQPATDTATNSLVGSTPDADTDPGTTVDPNQGDGTGGSTTGTLPDFDCTWVHSSDGKVHAKTCSDYIVREKKDGKTYFAVKGWGSAWSNECCDFVTDYAAGNKGSDAVYVFGWAPGGTNDVGRCDLKTASTEASLGGVTIGVTEEKEVCPSKWNMFPDWFNDHSSGAIWKAVDDAHTPGIDDPVANHFVQLARWDRSKILTLNSRTRVWWD